MNMATAAPTAVISQEHVSKALFRRIQLFRLHAHPPSLLNFTLIHRVRPIQVIVQSMWAKGHNGGKGKVSVCLRAIGQRVHAQVCAEQRERRGMETSFAHTKQIDTEG